MWRVLWLLAAIIGLFVFCAAEVEKDMQRLRDMPLAVFDYSRYAGIGGDIV